MNIASAILEVHVLDLELFTEGKNIITKKYYY